MNPPDDTPAIQQRVGATVLQVGRCYRITLDLPVAIDADGTGRRLVIEGVGSLSQVAFHQLNPSPHGKFPDLRSKVGK